MIASNGSETLMGGWVRLVAVCSFVLWLELPAVAATQYFVATNGNDLAAGTAAAPWKSLQRAANVVLPGDRVTVRAGDYTGFYLSRSGSPAATIEFFAEPGVRIVQRNATTPDGINLEGASHIVIDGFHVAGMPRAGVRSVGFPADFAQFVTVRNVHATNNGVWGIFTGHVNDLLIESNLTSGSIDEHGIYVSNSGDRPVIRNNVIFDNHGSGIHMNGDLSQGGDGIISGAVVSGNKIFNNAIPNSEHPSLGGGSGINMDGVQNSRIENNLVYNNHASGISLYKIDAAAGASGNVVVNNTVYQPNNGRWALNIRDGSNNNTAYNNILLSQHSYRGAISLAADSLPGFKSDYNTVISRFTANDGGSVQNLAEWQAATGNDLHSLVATAAQLFVNPAGDATANYHLLAAAAAINKGTNLLAPVIDIEALPRPSGGVFDIGAYEWQLPMLTGDYNSDRKVDIADFVLWRNTMGTSVARFSGADGDGSGVVDAADYAVWRTHFGATAAGASVGFVPEPESIVLATSMLIAMHLIRGRRWASTRPGRPALFPA
jgi:parallel beta-helix repeat protein